MGKKIAYLLKTNNQQNQRAMHSTQKQVACELSLKLAWFTRVIKYQNRPTC